MLERIIPGDLVIDDNLIFEGFNYIVKGNLTVEGTVLIKNGGLIVEGDLLVNSKHSFDVSVYYGSIYAKSITVATNISIMNGNISTLKDLNCMDITCYLGDISVGGNTSVHSVACSNYLVDGKNNSLDIEADNVVYIMDFSNSGKISAQEIFLGGGGDFGGASVITNHFEFDGHVYNCQRRYRFLK